MLSNPRANCSAPPIWWMNLILMSLLVLRIQTTTRSTLEILRRRVLHPAIRTTWYSVRTLINQQHPSGQQDLFRLDTHQCLEAHQSLKRSQCSSAYVRMTWLYHSDAIQGLTNIRVFASRHSYGKTAATVWMMCDSIRTMFSIRQDVHQFNRLDISL